MQTLSRLILFNCFTVLAIISFFIFSGCGGGGVKLVVKEPSNDPIADTNNSIQQSIQVQTILQDAPSGLPLGAMTTAPMTVILTATSPALILDLQGNPSNQFLTTDGTLEFILSTAAFSIQTPTEIRYLVQPQSSYLSTGGLFSVDDSGIQTISVGLVPLSTDRLPTGVSAVIMTEAVTSGGFITSSIELSAGSTISGAGAVAVTLPAGVQMRDSDGNIMTGNLSLSVTHFSAITTQTLEFFPGGPE